jgi:predicted nucleotidyltransferase
MGLNIDPSTLVAGYRASTIKKALVHFNNHRNVATLVDLKSLFPTRRDGVLVYELCKLKGFIDQQTSSVTEQGMGFARSRLTQRVSLEKAISVLRELIAKIEQFNADDDQTEQIDDVWLFGSVMRGEPNVGDIDLAISTSWRHDPGEAGRNRRDGAARALAKHKLVPPEGLHLWELPRWTTERIIFGPRRNRLLTGVQMTPDDLIGIAAPCQLIYNRQDGGRVKMPITPNHPNAKPRLEKTDIATISTSCPCELSPMDARWLGWVDRMRCEPARKSGPL